MKVVHEQAVLRRVGSWRYGVPGAIALIGAVAFVTGVFDSGVREMLFDVLIGSLVCAVVFGAIAIYARRSLVHSLRILKGDGLTAVIEGPSVRVELTPLRYAYGVYSELITAGAARRNAPVVWVQMAGAGKGPIVTIRKALGIQHAVPDWPSVAPAFDDDAHVFSGEPQALQRALARAGAEERGRTALVA